MSWGAVGVSLLARPSFCDVFSEIHICCLFWSIDHMFGVLMLSHICRSLIVAFQVLLSLLSGVSPYDFSHRHIPWKNAASVGASTAGKICPCWEYASCCFVAWVSPRFFTILNFTVCKSCCPVYYCPVEFACGIFWKKEIGQTNRYAFKVLFWLGSWLMKSSALTS